MLGERPEPEQTFRTTLHVIDAADGPLSNIDSVVLAFLIDLGTESRSGGA